MTSFSQIARRARLSTLILPSALALCLAGCNDKGGDPKAQIGPHPNLPEQTQYLLPPMHIAKVVGWKQGETPTVAPGLKIEALATGLQHPRSLYVLPNGDILVAESKSPGTQPVTRPKDIVMAWVESLGHFRRRHRAEQPDHAVAWRRRRRAEIAKRISGSSAFAVWHGARRRRSLRRQYRRDR